MLAAGTSWLVAASYRLSLWALLDECWTYRELDCVRPACADLQIVTAAC